MEINYTQWKTNQINFYVLSLEDERCPNLLSCRVWCSAREVSIPEHGFDRNAATQVHSLDSPNPSFPPWSCSSQSIYHCCYLYHCCSLKWFPLSYTLTTMQSHETRHRGMGQNWHEFKMQIATCQWNMWEYRHSPIHACHGPVGGDKTPAFRVYEPCGRSIWADTYWTVHIPVSFPDLIFRARRSGLMTRVVRKARCCHFCWSRYSACALLLKVKVSVSLSNWQVEWKSRLVVYIVSRSWPNSRESAELWSKLGRSE